MAEPTTPTHLPPSALGTKEYWDNLYNVELSNHASNPSDTGTVWFDDSDAESKMVQFLDARAHSGVSSALDPQTARVLDLGCGNGSLLFALRDEGWRGRLMGVDYSERSVELARRVGISRGLLGRRRSGEDGEWEEQEQEKQQQEEEEEEEDGASSNEVEFRVWDVLAGSLDDVRASPASTTTTEEDGKEEGDCAGWDLVLDKGTFDAVSLSDEKDGQGRRICEGYGERVLQLLRVGGIFLVTSCNWTETELREWFESKTRAVEGGAKLKMAGRIEYPCFSFGGVKGQTISTLCFEKVVA
ncbi:hypothetical protein VTI74DRAFT_8397 [Chaetomium olivicolor]